MGLPRTSVSTESSTTEIVVETRADVTSSAASACRRRASAITRSAAGVPDGTAICTLTTNVAGSLSTAGMSRGAGAGGRWQRRRDGSGR
ncbi:hypothetical protein ACFQX7_14990 [Luedemannella flava]